MATISIFIPDNDIDRVRTALKANYNYLGNDTDEFTNSIIRGFLMQNVKVYEEQKVKEQAIEDAAGQIGNVTIDNGVTATPHKYYMICEEAAKPQYDYLANQLVPGLSFSKPLSADGQAPATHYYLEQAVTEEIKTKLSAIEIMNSLSSQNSVNYVRCDSITEKSIASNIENFPLGQECILGTVLSFLGLREIE